MSGNDCGCRPLSDVSSCPDDFSESGQILQLLQSMKDKGWLQSIKMEFEAEGVRLDEAQVTGSWARQLQLPLTVKIGGCEAVTDLDLSHALGASRLVAPMIESSFAVSKFKGAAQRVYGQAAEQVSGQAAEQESEQAEWILNLETRTAYEHLDEILEAGRGFITAVNIGRVDLSASLGLPRGQVDSQQMLDICQDMARRSRNAGYAVGFGGGVGPDSIPFVQAMASLVDCFETRKAVFAITDDPATIKDCIADATEFELLCLQVDHQLRGSLTQVEQERRDMLQRRLDQVRAGCGVTE